MVTAPLVVLMAPSVSVAALPELLVYVSALPLPDKVAASVPIALLCPVPCPSETAPEVVRFNVPASRFVLFSCDKSTVLVKLTV
jgi:hypothetical protein